MTKEKKLKEEQDDYPSPGAIDAFFLRLELKERARDRLPFLAMAAILAVGIIWGLFL